MENPPHKPTPDISLDADDSMNELVPEDAKTVMDMYEVINKIGKEFKISIRKEIPFSEIQALDRQTDLLQFLRKRVFDEAMN